jgi:GT2 family glycosyltransferase
MDKIPRIFVINLPHRTDRLESVKSELDRMGLLDKMEVVEGVVIESNGLGTAGVAEAHARCVELAKQRGYEMIMILEDDCKFLVEKDVFHSEIEEFLNTAPSDWNGVWFGSFWQSPVYPEEKFPHNWIVPTSITHDTATIFHSRFYSQIIGTYRFCRDRYIETTNEKYNIDSWVSNNIPIYSLKRRLCGQATCYSDRVFKYMNGGCDILL